MIKSKRVVYICHPCDYWTNFFALTLSSRPRFVLGAEGKRAGCILVESREINAVP